MTSEPPPPPPPHQGGGAGGWGQPAGPPGQPGGWSPPGAPGQYPQQRFTREHPQGTTILVLGILSLVICSFLGPFAWSMGNRALREIDASGDYFTNRGNINAGRICGMIASILLMIGGTILVIAVIVAAAST